MCLSAGEVSCDVLCARNKLQSREVQSSQPNKVFKERGMEG